MKESKCFCILNPFLSRRRLPPGAPASITLKRLSLRAGQGREAVSVCCLEQRKQRVFGEGPGPGTNHEHCHREPCPNGSGERSESYPSGISGRKRGCRTSDLGSQRTARPRYLLTSGSQRAAGDCEWLFLQRLAARSPPPARPPGLLSANHLLSKPSLGGGHGGWPQP